MEPPPRIISLDDTLALRAFAGEADLAELFRVIDESLEHLRPWMPWVSEHSRDRTAQFLTKRTELWATGAAYAYAITLDGAIVGMCGLFRRDENQDGLREIGYWLHPSATGRGLATRTTRTLTELAFRLLGVDVVEIVHDAANLPSAAVPARLGFTAYERRPNEALAPAETGMDQVWRLTRDQVGHLTRDEVPQPARDRVRRPGRPALTDVP
ncbi:GNAT family N-acetyltransferase [Streptomyces sp. NPDC048491]|uniref:GNAT family N-acetyltransferase n=1 Tax=Streptomyces sp. NPDC048491 TaxID=3157207 RepID=UPI00343F6BD4